MKISVIPTTLSRSQAKDLQAALKSRLTVSAIIDEWPRLLAIFSAGTMRPEIPVALRQYKASSRVWMPATSAEDLAMFARGGCETRELVLLQDAVAYGLKKSGEKK